MTAISNRTLQLVAFGILVAVITLWQQQAITTVFPHFNPVYEAPFPNRGKGHHLIPDAYSITLFSGHTIDDVSAATGRDIGSFVDFIVKSPPSDGKDEQLVYRVKNVDKELLAVIRSYRGVRLVEHSARVVPARA